ncbi:serine threonine- kinase endoribonuclease IRE1, partial [Paramuricea clavata]
TDENLDLDTDEDSNKNLKTFGTSDQNEGPGEKRKLENLAVIREQGSNKKIKTENAMVIQDQVPVAVSGESWKWEETSIVHREKFIKLGEYRKTHPKDIKEVNGVHVCCSNEFLIGKGSDGTRVYVGLEKNGHERAVKRLPRDVCTGLAEQEKKVLKELNETKSNYVVNYWFLDEQSDRDYLFIILDLCEETLENFVANSSDDDLVKIAPDIIRQVLKGLADLHCEPMPILHRDLKPSNILRNVHDKWLLADFGISRILTEGASTLPTTDQRGTEDWRAVESNNMAADDGKLRFKKESDIQ